MTRRPTTSFRSGTPDQLPREAVLADLERFLAALPRAAVYTDEAHTGALLGVQRLQTQAGLLTGAHLLAGLARIVASARDGHTNLDFGQLGQALPQVPVRFGWFADGLYVTAVGSAQADWLGCEVVELEGRPAGAWPALLSAVIGGTLDWVRRVSPPVLITPAFLHALGWGAEGCFLQLRLRTPAGRRVNARLRVGDPPPTLSLTPGTGALNAPAPGASVHVQSLPGGALYVGLRQIDSGTDGPLPDVLAGTLEHIRTTRPERVVVDLRGNGGGNYVLSWPFTQALRGAAGEARLSVLIDEGTFSAAIVTLAWLRHDAGARIVGSGPGDAERFHAEPLCVPLTSVPARVFLATQSHDWAQNRLDLRAGFWLNLLYGVPAGSLRPDIGVQGTFAEFMRGHDAPLLAALADDGPSLPSRRGPLDSGSPAPQQVAVGGMLLGTLGVRHGRDEWQAVGELMERLSGLSAGELEALRLQQQPTLGHSDGELVRALRECRAALTPLIIAASPSGSR